MLQNIIARQHSLNISTRSLAKQLEVSPSTLSELLNAKRPPSAKLKKKLDRWLKSPIATGGENHPNTIYKSFIAERSGFVSQETLRYYKEKLEPFILWCEKQDHSDITMIDRTVIGDFLAYVRKGRRSHSNASLNNGALKLHHQTLKTLFNYTAEILRMPMGWSNPVSLIKVKSGNASRSEYSEHELSVMMQLLERQSDQLLRLRNIALVKVLLNSALRATELLSLRVNDIGDDGHLNITGKGGTRRTVAIGRSGIDAIDNYLDVRADSNGRLWKTRSGSILTRKGLQQVFNHLKEQAPNTFPDGLYAHRFRHTAITRLLRTGVPLRSVQLYAGHSNPQTTLRYAQAIDADEAIAAVETLNY